MVLVYSERAALEKMQAVRGWLLHGPPIELKRLGELAHVPVAVERLTERFSGLPGAGGCGGMAGGVVRFTLPVDMPCALEWLGMVHQGEQQMPLESRVQGRFHDQ